MDDGDGLWEVPLPIPDMRMAFAAFKDGRVPSAEFVEALKGTAGLGPREGGGADRRRIVAVRFMQFLKAYQETGRSPRGNDSLVPDREGTQRGKARKRRNGLLRGGRRRE